MKSICILGLGYIGLPTAAMFATHGYKVYGVDVNNKIIEILNNGNIHIEEPGLKTLVQASIKSENLCVSCYPQPADAFIIAVPTPFKHGEFGEYAGKTYKLADMSAVTAAAEAIVPHLCRGNLVILESTSPPRTTVDLVRPILERSGLVAGKDFYLAYSPERVLPGRIMHELIENARVIGGIDTASAEAGRDLYAAFVKGEIVLTDATTAEMVKLMENTYRDINIAIANEFARLADRLGVDAWEAIEIANRHPRVKILFPGPGVGGHCISVDPWFLVEVAPDLAELIRTARQVNDAQPEFVVDLVCRTLGGNVMGKTIAALGLAFKPDVDDLRESPAVEIVQQLNRMGARIKAYEPHKVDARIDGIAMCVSIEDTLRDSDLVLVLVGHQAFRKIDPSTIRSCTRTALIIDTINVLAGSDWQASGVNLIRLGDGHLCPLPK